MKQIRIQRRPRRQGGGGEPATSLLPVSPVSDTRGAHDVLARIERALDGR